VLPLVKSSSVCIHLLVVMLSIVPLFLTYISLSRFAEINKKAAWSLCNGVWMTHSDINKVKVISQLLCVRHSYVNLDCFNSADIDFMIESMRCVPIRPSSFIVCVFLFFIFCVLLYDIHFHNNNNTNNNSNNNRPITRERITDTDSLYMHR